MAEVSEKIRIDNETTKQYKEVLEEFEQTVKLNEMFRKQGMLRPTFVRLMEQVRINTVKAVDRVSRRNRDKENKKEKSKFYYPRI